MQLAPLDNSTIFKRAFTDKVVFTQFVKDIVGIDIEVDKIETEKKFDPKMGKIDFTLDIFAESIDHRVVIEIQRIDYDYNFDRFLHYFLMAIAQLQQNHLSYEINQTVYVIVVLTAPYKLTPRHRFPVRDDVLITSLDPRNLEGTIVPIYGHKLIFLNPNYTKDHLPANYKDWLELINQSIHKKSDYILNLKNKGIEKVVSLIEYDNLDGETMAQMKIEAQRKIMRDIDMQESRDEGFKEGKDEGKKEMARQLKLKSIPIEIIAESSGLTIEEIEKL